MIDKSDIALLLEHCKKRDVATFRSSMKLSKPLAELNHDRFLATTTRCTKKNLKVYLLLFKGDVYRGLDVASPSR